jgi:hypothetical protein
MYTKPSRLVPLLLCILASSYEYKQEIAATVTSVTELLRRVHIIRARARVTRYARE